MHWWRDNKSFKNQNLSFENLKCDTEETSFKLEGKEKNKKVFKDWKRGEDSKEVIWSRSFEGFVEKNKQWCHSKHVSFWNF
jgi:hypothetical protein